LDRLPRRCPVCKEETIVGHGRRLRQAHDPLRDQIWVRRGICRLCHKTFTFLPQWLAPSAHFTLHCRRQACERLAAGDPVEHALPHCKDPARLPDASTLRRWAQRRWLSVWCCIKNEFLKDFLQMPTIVAWDLTALCRILPAEARSP